MKFITNIFKRKFKVAISQPSNKELPTVIVFAGGMGTQIFQAAAYFSLKQSGREVYADLRYFDRASKIATVGNAGELTHWFWQLDQFGLPQSSFETLNDDVSEDVDIIADGPKLLEMGLKALVRKEIQTIFRDTHGDKLGKILPNDVIKSFLCIHIRRGDYVNVAAHLVSDEEFIQLIKKFRGLVENIVILSDSPIEVNLREAVSPHFKQAMFLDHIDGYDSHRVMRHARILVCSNSTFSLTAAMLNPNALVFIPKLWFGPNDHALHAPIHSLCSFQVIE